MVFVCILYANCSVSLTIYHGKNILIINILMKKLRTHKKTFAVNVIALIDYIFTREQSANLVSHSIQALTKYT